MLSKLKSLKFIPHDLPRDKAMGDCQGKEAELSPLGGPGVHTLGEVKKLIKICLLLLLPELAMGYGYGDRKDNMFFSVDVEKENEFTTAEENNPEIKKIRSPNQERRDRDQHSHDRVKDERYGYGYGSSSNTISNNTTANNQQTQQVTKQQTNNALFINATYENFAPQDDNESKPFDSGYLE